MRWRGATYLVVYALAAITGTAHAADRLSHTGKIVDAATGKPLAQVAVVAFATSDIVDSKPCPKYEVSLHEVESADDGGFTLLIPTANASYVVTYCMTAYEVFTKKANKNLEDGAPIQPEPVRLWRVNGNGAAMSSAIKRVRDDAQKMIATTLYKNPAAVFATLNVLEEPEKVLVTRWLEQAYSLPPDTSSRPTQDLGQLTQSVRTTLAYFEKANPQHFRSEVKQFGEIDQYVQKRERLPPESVDPVSPNNSVGLTRNPPKVGGDGKEFLLRIFMSGLIAFIPSSDGRELTVVLLDTGRNYEMADGSRLPHHKPLLLARAARCEGACRPDDPSIIRFLYPRKAVLAGRASLDDALLGGGAWQLSGADLSLRGPEAPLDIHTGTRHRDSNGLLRSVPRTPVEREDFSWVADISDLAPDTDGYNFSLTRNRVVARLRLRSGKVITHSVMEIDGKARSVPFRKSSGEGLIAPYAQALANWVEARIVIPAGSSLEVVNQHFAHPTEMRTMKLHPVNGVVEMALLNLPSAGPSAPTAPASDPKTGQSFQIYYDLVNTPPAKAERLVPYLSIMRPSASDTGSNWITLHPRHVLWSNLLEKLRISPFGTESPEIALCQITTN